METITDITSQRTEGGNVIDGEPTLIRASTIYFGGTGNTVVFAPGARIACTIRFKGDNGHVRIGSGGGVRGAFMVGADSSIVLGDRLDVTGNLQITTSDGATVSVGDDCLFANNVSLRAYDDHPIFDLDTGKRINYSRPVTVGNHVWIGASVNVLGGSSIGDGCVIGVASVVTASHPIPAQCIAAGVPANVKRERIGWAKRPHPPMHEMPR